LRYRRAVGSWRTEARSQLRLAFPVVVIQLGLMAMGAVDGAFLGRVDAVQYAASAIGHTLTFVLFAFGMGALTVLDPVVSQARGAGDHTAISRGVQRGLVLALFLSVPISLLLLPAETWLRLMGQQPEVVEVAADYVRVSILGVPAFLVFVALRQSLQALHIVRPLVWTILLANGLNVFLDWVLIYGNLGFPAMGTVGSAWGTVVARWCMVLLLPLLIGEEFHRFLRPRADRLLHLPALGRMLRIGTPTGIQWFVEIGAFATVTALMGSLGEDELAGHQVAMHLAAGSFMVPLGISIAASVRVGTAIGRGDPGAVRRAAGVGLVSGAGVMLVAGAAFLLFPLPLARVFTDLDGVLAVAVVLVPLAGFFQVFDGTQVVAVGIMRGMADTRVPTIIHVLGFWGVALPIGCAIGFGLDRGAVGLWWGLVVGLGLVAVAQFLRLRVILRRGMSRVVIDHPEPEAGLQVSARKDDH
jgi:MATE family multidrug resistance protein